MNKRIKVSEETSQKNSTSLCVPDTLGKIRLITLLLAKVGSIKEGEQHDCI